MTQLGFSSCYWRIYHSCLLNCEELICNLLTLVRNYQKQLIDRQRPLTTANKKATLNAWLSFSGRLQFRVRSNGIVIYHGLLRPILLLRQFYLYFSLNVTPQVLSLPSPS